MQDLFPESLQPDALRDDMLPYLRPVFFAVYPADQDRPRLAEWQEQSCAGLPSAMALRPSGLLHVSVAACGRPVGKRQPLREAVQEAAKHFSFQSFDLAFETTASFGQDNRALVAIADAASQSRINALRIALADAQRWAGLIASRGSQVAHLTLGYGDRLPEGRRSIPPFRFHVGAVDLVMSDIGHSEHVRLDRWRLQQGQRLSSLFRHDWHQSCRPVTSHAEPER